MKKIILLYVPVLHNGYIEFFKRHSAGAETIFIVGDELIQEFLTLHKEIRQVNPALMKKIIESISFKKIEVLTPKIAAGINGKKVITATDTVSSMVAERYLSKTNKIEHDTTFLMWSSENVNSSAEVSCDLVSCRKRDREIMAELKKEAEKSSCWWRRTAAAFVKNGKILVKGHNEHLPSEFTPYSLGDPRDFIEAGKDSHIASSLHAEQKIIAVAAAKGIKTQGVSMYSLIFPCPMCAKPVSFSGIQRLYFQTEHASLNGLEMLKAKKIKIIQVK
ncbi:MAG: deaminase [Candidatus Pacebacteria bacterium]|nr:deaminase [Candidatus Paceibacterota bacterium]